MKLCTTPAVDAMGEIDFEGNTIPHTWYETLRLPNGKPDIIAITLLAEIVYWYRPVIERDEQSGGISRKRKKFKGDMFSRSYQAFADRFGFSRRQVERAIKRLKDRGLLHTEIRIVDGPKRRMGNVLFLEPIPAAIRAITHPRPPAMDAPPPHTMGGISPHATGGISPHAMDGMTYSEIISTEIIDGERENARAPEDETAAEEDGLTAGLSLRPEVCYYSPHVEVVRPPDGALDTSEERTSADRRRNDLDTPQVYTRTAALDISTTAEPPKPSPAVPDPLDVTEPEPARKKIDRYTVPAPDDYGTFLDKLESCVSFQMLRGSGAIDLPQDKDRRRDVLLIKLVRCVNYYDTGNRLSRPFKNLFLGWISNGIKDPEPLPKKEARRIAAEEKALTPAPDAEWQEMVARMKAFNETYDQEIYIPAKNAQAKQAKKTGGRAPREVRT